MTEGVVLKLSTEAASRGMREFDAVSKATLDTLAQQNRVLTSLEQTFRRQADAEAAATRAAESAATARKKANDSLAASFGIYGAGPSGGAPGPSGPRNLNVIADGLLNVGKKAEAAANGTAAATAKAAPLVQRFTAALGGSAGLGRAFGAVGGAAQLFLGAINPLYVAVGLAAAAIGELAIRAATAESPLQKVRRQAQEAQQSYDLLAESVSRASDALDRAASSRRGNTGTGSFANRFDAANQTLQGLKQAQAELDTAVSRGATGQNSPLTLPQIAKLAEALGKTEDVVKAIGELQNATGSQYDRALERVRASGLDISGDRQVVDPVLFQRNLRLGVSPEAALERRGLVTLDPARAEEIIAAALGEAATNVQQLLIQRAREEFQTEIRQLGARALANQGVVRQAGYQSADQFNRVNQDLNRQIEFLGASGPERERLLREQRIRAAQDQAGVAPGSLAGGKIKEQVEELSNLEKAEQSFQRLKDLGRDTFDTIANSIGQAVLEGKNLRQVLSSVGNNISQLLLSRAIGAASNAIFGPATPAQLGRVLPSRWMMGGGVLDRSQTIVSGGYAINVAEGGGAAPEAILPLGKDKFGRLGVRSDGGGGGGAVIINLPNVRSGEEARRVRPTLTQTVESVNRRSRRTLRAGR